MELVQSPKADIVLKKLDWMGLLDDALGDDQSEEEFDPKEGQKAHSISDS